MKSFFNHQFWAGLIAGALATGVIVMVSSLFFPSQEALDRRADEAFITNFVGKVK